jgi:hypothetical protein
MLFLFGILTLNTVLVGCERAAEIAMARESATHDIASSVADTNALQRKETTAASLQQVRRAAVADAALSF